MFYKTGLLSRGLTIERGLTFQYLRYVRETKVGKEDQLLVKPSKINFVFYSNSIERLVSR